MSVTSSIAHARVPEEQRASPPRGRSDDPHRLPDALLVERIVDEHHAYTRRALQAIVPVLGKVAAFHGRRNRKLEALYDAGNALADVLERHLDDEERDLFPALVEGRPPRAVLVRELAHMADEHGEILQLLARMRSLSDGYVAPEWGGASYRALMEDLEALETDLLRHAYLEDDVLLPRLVTRYGEAC